MGLACLSLAISPGHTLPTSRLRAPLPRRETRERAKLHALHLRILRRRPSTSTSRSAAPPPPRPGAAAPLPLRPLPPRRLLCFRTAPPWRQHHRVLSEIPICRRAPSSAVSTSSSSSVLVSSNPPSPLLQRYGCSIS